jgi:hypothetical protein
VDMLVEAAAQDKACSLAGSEAPEVVDSNQHNQSDREELGNCNTSNSSSRLSVPCDIRGFASCIPSL